jgi:hypothetical protein
MMMVMKMMEAATHRKPSAIQQKPCSYCRFVVVRAPAKAKLARDDFVMYIAHCTTAHYP